MGRNNCVILVVDDERHHADGIAESLEKFCRQVKAVYSGAEAMDYLENEDVDIVITDLKLEDDVDGLDVLRAARAKGRPEVILVTAFATIDTCKQAIKEGAYDYLIKPIDIDQLRTLIDRISREVCERKQDSSAVAGSGDEFVFEGVEGSNPAMKHIFQVLRRVAKSDIAVLIEGPSGTGKELLARAIHNNSRRRREPFKPINCAGLTESLLESELFGHAKGAFTGAATERKGLFEVADKGTLFLDEIGDMPMNMQAKLLRVLEDGVVTPVGSNEQIVVDVRVISATNHNLNKLIEEGKFRQDLYFRIKGVSVSVPPLNQRPEDIPSLVEFFIAEAAGETGLEVKGITDSALNILQNYSWPGNIRQLKNSIRTMVVMCDRDMLDVRDIPPEIHQLRQLSGLSAGGNLGGVALEELEKKAIIDTLNQTHNNREKAAKILGIGERTLYRKIKEYGI